MGRPLSGEPYRVAGEWRLHLGGGKRVVLGQAAVMDYAEAKSKASTLVPGEMRGTVSDVEQTPVASAPIPPQPKPMDATEILSSWAAAQESSGPSEAGKPPSPSVPTVSGGSTSTAIRTTTSASVPPRRSGGLTPEQAEKIGRGLKKVMTKINVIGAEVLVRLVGRDPCEVDDDEVELVALGWELMCEQYFTKNKPQPWMVLAAGNVMLVLAMYMRGTPIVKKEDPDHVEITE